MLSSARSVKLHSYVFIEDNCTLAKNLIIFMFLFLRDLSDGQYEHSHGYTKLSDYNSSIIYYYFMSQCTVRYASERYARKKFS